MNVSFQGQLTTNDFRQAVKLHYGNSQISFFVLLLIGIVLIVLGNTVLKRTVLEPPSVIVGGMIALLGIMRHPFMASRFLLRPGGGAAQPRTGTATEEEVTIQLPYATETMEWRIFYKEKHSEDMALLYTNKNCFLIFPRTFFPSDAEWNQFTEIASARVQTTL